MWSFFFFFFYRAWHLQENLTFMHMILLCVLDMYHVHTLAYQYGLSRFISMVYQELSMVYHSVPWYISKCHGFTIWNLHCEPQQYFSLTVSRNHMIHWHIPFHKKTLIIRNIYNGSTGLMEINDFCPASLLLISSIWQR